MDTTYLIVDDEAPAHQVLKSHISQFDSTAVFYHANNGLEALQLLEKHTIDVLFLDIEMPKINGLEVLQNMKQKPATIMTTAYTEFAFEAYQYDVIDYIQKPIEFARFVKAMSKVPAKNTVKAKNTHLEIINENKSIGKIAFENIVYIESMGNYIKIHLHIGKTIIQHNTLKNILQIIDEELFVQISKSFIVHLKFVKTISSTMLELQNGTILSLGRQYKELVLKTYNQ